MDDALAVAEDLHLDVARALDHLLEVEPAVAEGGLRLGAGLRHQALELAHVGGDADAAAAAAGRRLDHHRESRCDFAVARACLGIVDPAVAAGNAGTPAASRRLACRDLVAHQADRLGARADEDQAGAAHRVGEAGILREKAVAGMDGVGAALLRAASRMAAMLR